MPITLVALFHLFGAALSLLPMRAQVAVLIVLGLGLPISCLAANFAVLGLAFRDFKPFRKEGLLYELSRCPGCRHDLRGVPGLSECPECGLAIDLERLAAERLVKNAWYIAYHKRKRKRVAH